MTKFDDDVCPQEGPRRHVQVSIAQQREFAKTIKRPFSVYYNPYTQSIDLLKDTRSIENGVQDLCRDLTTVCDALDKMNTYLGI
ncbi:tryptophan 5-hydroxylase 2-like [Coregonus clupeaformis]|uniref:tryptophan 5-hydroxylase 2-like n=1 Tax=Coregonus clupeaformis TaxID=59861 RepID=UPI001BE0502C|nr:tryptophan 5-hydroxylase 2-like [Coregonus clupeaformis]